MSHHQPLPALDRGVALTFEGLVWPHALFMLVGSGCIHPSVVESFAWFFCISSKVKFQAVVIVNVCHAIATDGGVGGVSDHGLCLDMSVALTYKGLIRPHFMLVGSGCMIHPYVVESFAWFFCISSPS